MPDDPITMEDVRRTAREEVVSGWEQAGVDVTTTAGRLELQGLVAWTRERKRVRETSSNQVRLTFIAGVVMALLSAMATIFSIFGGHFPRVPGQ